MITFYRKILAASFIVALCIALAACTAKESSEPAYKQIPQEKQLVKGEDKAGMPAATPVEAKSTGSPFPQATELPKAVPELKAAAPTPFPNPPAMAVSPEKAAEADKLYEQGFQIYMGGKYDEAIKLFDKAIEADPGSYKGYNGKGIALCFKGNYDQGIPLIKKALEIKPDFTYANFNMAMAYKLQKNYDQALIWFNKALSYDPNDAWSYYGISTIYADRNDPSKAIEYLRKAAVLDPGTKAAAKEQSHYDNMRSNPEFINVVK